MCSVKQHITVQTLKIYVYFQLFFSFLISTFQKISFFENEKFPRYNLYAYSEGRLTEAARNMKFNGAPVIFVPGNGGSYKQVYILPSPDMYLPISTNSMKKLIMIILFNL